MISNPSNKNFSEVVNNYHVMVFDLSEYRRSTRKLPEEFFIIPVKQLKKYREQEKRLLKSLFDNWAVAYCRQLKGFRNDSPILAAKGNELVGGAYLCEKTSYDSNIQSGEIHYTYVSPEYTGMGIYSVLFREAVDRSISWGLSKLYVTTDRHLLPDMYIRWGAKNWKTFPKSRLLNLPPVRMIQKLTRKFRYYWYRTSGKCS